MFGRGPLSFWFKEAAFMVFARGNVADMGGYGYIEEKLPFTTQEELEEAMRSPTFVRDMCKAALGPRFNEKRVAYYEADDDFKKAFKLLFRHQYFDAQGNIVKRNSMNIPALYHNIQVMDCYKHWMDDLPKDDPYHVPEYQRAHKGLILVALLHDLFEDSHLVKVEGYSARQMRQQQEKISRTEIVPAFKGKLGTFIAEGISQLTDPPQINGVELAAHKKIDKFKSLINKALTADKAIVQGAGFPLNIDHYLHHLVIMKVFDKGNNLQSDIDGLLEQGLFNLKRLEEKTDRTIDRFSWLEKLGERFDASVRRKIKVIIWSMEKGLPMLRRFKSRKMRFVRSIRGSFSLSL